VRQEVRRELLAEAKKHQAWKQLCQIPSIGPIRAAVLLGILQTPHRFRTKRLWTYSGFGIETHSSADHRRVDGQLKRVKKQSSIRGLTICADHRRPTSVSEESRGRLFSGVETWPEELRRERATEENQ
jgi:transposase